MRISFDKSSCVGLLHFDAKKLKDINISGRVKRARNINVINNDKYFFLSAGGLSGSDVINLSSAGVTGGFRRFSHEYFLRMFARNPC